MTKVDVVDGWFNKTIRNPYFVVFAMLLLAIGVLIWVVLQLSGLVEEGRNARKADLAFSQQNNELLKQVKAIGEEIESCTTPEGECTQRGEQRTGNIGAAITYCTLNLPAMAKRDEVTGCILKELNRQEGNS